MLSLSACLVLARINSLNASGWEKRKEILDNAGGKKKENFQAWFFVCGAIPWLLFCSLSHGIMWLKQGHLATSPDSKTCGLQRGIKIPADSSGSVKMI